MTFEELLAPVVENNSTRSIMWSLRDLLLRLESRALTISSHGEDDGEALSVALNCRIALKALLAERPASGSTPKVTVSDKVNMRQIPGTRGDGYEVVEGPHSVRGGSTGSVTGSGTTETPAMAGMPKADTSAVNRLQESPTVPDSGSGAVRERIYITPTDISAGQKLSAAPEASPSPLVPAAKLLREQTPLSVADECSDGSGQTSRITTPNAGEDVAQRIHQTASTQSGPQDSASRPPHSAKCLWNMPQANGYCTDSDCPANPFKPESLPSRLSAREWLVKEGLPNKVLHYFKDDGEIDQEHGELVSDLLEAYALAQSAEQQPPTSLAEAVASLCECYEGQEEACTAHQLSAKVLPLITVNEVELSRLRQKLEIAQGERDAEVQMAKHWEHEVEKAVIELQKVRRELEQATQEQCAHSVTTKGCFGCVTRNHLDAVKKWKAAERGRSSYKTLPSASEKRK